MCREREGSGEEKSAEEWGEGLLAAHCSVEAPSPAESSEPSSPDLSPMMTHSPEMILSDLSALELQGSMVKCSVCAQVKDAEGAFSKKQRKKSEHVRKCNDCK